MTSAARKKTARQAPEAPTPPAASAEQPRTEKPSTDQHPEFGLEATHLGGTISAMLRQIEAWEDRSRNVGADLETSLTLADTAEEYAAVLSPHVHAPYFGSLKVRVGGKDDVLYIGKHAFRDLSGKHSVMSWESDAGALFYQSDLSWKTRRGLEGKITRKRQLDVQAKVLLRVTDLHDDLHDEAAQGEQTGRQEVLLRRLSEASSGGMRDVVETLQPEQDAAVRSPAGQHVIIQGAAGSGKTTMAFHRLAWLAHAQRGEERTAAARTLVLMPNPVLARYAARVLPGLGLEGTSVTTPEAWALSFLGLEKMESPDGTFSLLLADHDRERRMNAWRRARALGDLRMLAVVRRHLESRAQERAAQLSLQTRAWVRGKEHHVEITSARLGELLEIVTTHAGHEGYRAALSARVMQEIMDQLSVSGEAEAELARTLGAEVTALSGKVFSSMLPVTESRRLLQEPALRAAAAGLIPEASIRAILSDPLSGVAKPRRSHVDASELPLVLAVAGLLGGLGQRVGARLEPYDHIVLDEGQDYAPLLYALLARAARPGHLTVLGDASQGIHGYKGPASWTEVQSALGGEHAAPLRTLTKTYRSTRQISELTARVAVTYNPLASLVGVDRQGAAVMRLSGEASGEALAPMCARAIKAMLADGHMNIGVVTRTSGLAERLAAEVAFHDVHATPIANTEARYEGGVVALPVSLAKGLEFDGCVVAQAGAETFDPATPFESRLLYVAASRGLHALALVAEGALHPLLVEENT